MRGGPPTVELLRPVGPEVPSDARVQQVLDLCTGSGEVLLSSGESADDASKSMTRVAAACGLRTVDVLLGGGVVIAVCAAVVSALIDRLGRVLGRRGVLPFFLQLVGAAVATVSTLGLFAAGALPAGTRPALVIAAGLTVQDAISSYHVTAAGRATEIATLSAGLLAGVGSRPQGRAVVRPHPGPGRAGERRRRPLRRPDPRSRRGCGDARPGELRPAVVASLDTP